MSVYSSSERRFPPNKSIPKKHKSDGQSLRSTKPLSSINFIPSRPGGDSYRDLAQLICITPVRHLVRVKTPDVPVLSKMNETRGNLNLLKSGLSDRPLSETTPRDFRAKTSKKGQWCTIESGLGDGRAVKSDNVVGDASLITDEERLEKRKEDIGENFDRRLLEEAQVNPIKKKTVNNHGFLTHTRSPASTGGVPRSTILPGSMPPTLKEKTKRVIDLSKPPPVRPGGPSTSFRETNRFTSATPVILFRKRICVNKAEKLLRAGGVSREEDEKCGNPVD